MADGAENGEGTTQDPKDNEVVMTQEKLDGLFNKSYGKGAEKAKAELLKELGFDSIEKARELIKAKNDADEANKTELQKAADNLSTLNGTIKDLEGRNKLLESDARIGHIAAKNGISDSEYFKFLFDKESKDDKFDEDTFITKLKKDKPSLFSETIKANIDNSPNKKPKDFSEKVTKAKTMAELYALQDNV